MNPTSQPSSTRKTPLTETEKAIRKYRKKLKNAKTLYDMGMKVAAVSVMCQDKRVFDAMLMAGTPCPYDGLIGLEAKAGWETHTADQPVEEEKAESMDETIKQTLWATSGVASLLLLLLL